MRLVDHEQVHAAEPPAVLQASAPHSESGILKCGQVVWPGKTGVRQLQLHGQSLD